VGREVAGGLALGEVGLPQLDVGVVELAQHHRDAAADVLADPVELGGGVGELRGGLVVGDVVAAVVDARVAMDAVGVVDAGGGQVPDGGDGLEEAAAVPAGAGSVGDLAGHEGPDAGVTGAVVDELHAGDAVAAGVHLLDVAEEAVRALHGPQEQPHRAHALALEHRAGGVAPVLPERVVVVGGAGEAVEMAGGGVAEAAVELDGDPALGVLQVLEAEAGVVDDASGDLVAEALAEEGHQAQREAVAEVRLGQGRVVEARAHASARPG
jgi:hypothetical protein